MEAGQRAALAVEWQVTLALVILAGLAGIGCLGWGAYLGRRGQLTRGDLERARLQLVRTWGVWAARGEAELAIPFDLARSLRRITAWQYVCAGAGILVGALTVAGAMLVLLPLGTPLLPMTFLALVLLGGMVGGAQGTVTSAQRLASGPDAARVAHGGTAFYRRWRLTAVTLALVIGACALTWSLAPHVLASAPSTRLDVLGVRQPVGFLQFDTILMVVAVIVVEYYTRRLVRLPPLRLTEDAEWARRLVGAERRQRHALVRVVNGQLPTMLIFFAMGPYGIFLAFSRFTSPLEYGLTTALLGLYLGVPVVAWVVVWAQGRLRWGGENPRGRTTAQTVNEG